MSKVTPARVAPNTSPSVYAVIWRWHLYAGLFCLPFIIVLALTGSIYLFKPEIEAWQDRPYDRLATEGPYASPDRQVAMALAATPGARLKTVEVRRSPGDALRVHVAWRGEAHRVLVHPTTARVLAVQAEDDRFMAVVREIHGELLMGDQGSLLVELAASWAIVMIVSGLYLWWPRGARSLAGVVYPRLSARGRLFWRDLHAVTGVWIAGLALFLLLTGLPWTSVWGDGFKAARRITGTAAMQDWTTRRATDNEGPHAAHGSAHAANASSDLQPLPRLIETVRALDLPPPVLLAPPSGRGTMWTARSDTPNRPLRVLLKLDGANGGIVAREVFEDRHPIDRVVGYGTAAHEGQLFGVTNQIVGLATAAGLIGLSCAGAWMWWCRRPPRGVGPLQWRARSVGPTFYGGVALAGVLLPMFGLSLLVILVLDRALFRSESV